MEEENTHIPGATITVEETGTSQETPFDRLEEFFALSGASKSR